MTLKQLREDHDISQTDFAAMLGIGRASLIRYEQGIRTPPPKVANRIAQEFNLSIEEIWAMFYERPA